MTDLQKLLLGKLAESGAIAIVIYLDDKTNCFTLDIACPESIRQHICECEECSTKITQITNDIVPLTMNPAKEANGQVN